MHYGERNAVLAAALAARGALLEELCCTNGSCPEDVAPLQLQVTELVAEGWTRSRHDPGPVSDLFRVAAGLGRCERLARALNEDAVVAAVGPVCADALRVSG